jgi:hypothetical protein
MALPVVHVPAGAILRLADGKTVELKAGEHYDANAGTQYPLGPAGTAEGTLTTRSEIVAQPAPGQEVPGVTSTGTPAAAPQTTSPSQQAAKARVWNETPAGAHLSQAYEAMRTTFAVNMTKQREQISTLAHRHIGG